MELCTLNELFGSVEQPVRLYITSVVASTANAVILKHFHLYNRTWEYSSSHSSNVCYSHLAQKGNFKSKTQATFLANPYNISHLIVYTLLAYTLHSVHFRASAQCFRSSSWYCRAFRRTFIRSNLSSIYVRVQQQCTLLMYRVYTEKAHHTHRRIYNWNGLALLGAHVHYTTSKHTTV